VACADHHRLAPTNRASLNEIQRAALFLRNGSSAIRRPVWLRHPGSFSPGYISDFVRHGAALYGINPQPGAPNPMPRSFG